MSLRFMIVTRRLSVSMRCCKTNSQQSCLFSSQQGTLAVQNLRTALEEYRINNYTQEVPTRFWKDIIRAACREQECKTIAVEDMERILTNIGYHNRISHQEMIRVAEELGRNDGTIPVEKLTMIMRSE